MAKTEVGIVYAGGTISSVMNSQGYREGGHEVDLLELMTTLAGRTYDKTVTISSSSFAYPGLSENMTNNDRAILAEHVREALSAGVHGVVVTHGTDSMEHTARYLDARFKNHIRKKDQRIILTGSNNDTSHPHTDAWDNIAEALSSAADITNKPGVYIAFHGNLIPAHAAIKEPYHGDQMHYVDKGSRKYSSLLREQNAAVKAMCGNFGPTPPSNSRNSVILYEVNLPRENHTTLNRRISSQTRAVLFRLYHSGTANTHSSNVSVSNLVNRLRIDHNIVSFGVTENGEPTDLRLYETSVKLRQAGMVPLYNMPEKVAYEKLLRLTSFPVPQLIIRMLTSICGEIDESQINRDDVLELINMYK